MSAIVFASALPAYAQTPSPSLPQTNQSFFGEIASFFGNMFHHQNGQGVNSIQGQSQSGPMEGGEQISGAPKGPMITPNPSGQPSSLSMQQFRLSQLVREGKITQTQEQEILTELTSVQNQLKAWAQSNGIDPSYVIGGGPIMGFGQQRNIASSSGQQGQIQLHPMIRYQPGFGQGAQQGAGQQGGTQGGVQPPQQGQP